MARARTGSKGTRSRASNIVLAVAVVVLAVSLVAIGVLVYRYWSQNSAYEDLESHVHLGDAEAVKLADLTADWDALRQINPDIVGWIYIPDSRIDYPIVQGPDNQKYLDTAFDGSEGWFSSAGTIFVDAKNDPNFTDRNTFIYGHHMRDGSMFASLTDWESSAEFNQHRDIYLLTPKGNYHAKTFSLLKAKGTEEIVVTQFGSDESYHRYIQQILDRSLVEQTGCVFTADRIEQSFALCTCEYTQDDGRDLLFATVVATTVEDDPYIAPDEGALIGLDPNSSISFGTDDR